MGIKTTFELDGLLTQEDIDNRYFIMGQCQRCDEWTQIDSREQKPFSCSNCHYGKYDMRGSRSIRSWLVTKHIKTSKSRKKRY